MAETAVMNRDARGVLRGACKCGDCDLYMPLTDSLKCAYCDCVPARHANLTKDISSSRLVSEPPVDRDKVKEISVKNENDVALFIKKEDMQTELHATHTTPDPSQTNPEQIDNQPAKTIAFSVPEVGSSSDVHSQERVSSAHGLKSSGVRKRHASDTGGKEESKKQKQQTHHKQDKVSVEQIEMKPCKLLHLGHIPYTEILPSRAEAKVKGVFKIAYKWETIYVGMSSDCVFKQIRRQFSGNGKMDLFNFLKDLDRKELENVSVYWLDDSKYTHSCGKKSYSECIGKLQGEKPRFNTRGVPQRSKAEVPNNDTWSSTSMHGSANPVVSSSDEVGEYQKNSSSVAKQKSPSDDSPHCATGMHHTPKTTANTVAVDASRHFPESCSNKETKERAGNKIIISNKTGSSKQEPEQVIKKHQTPTTGPGAPCKNAGTDKSRSGGEVSGQLGGDSEISPVGSILPRSAEFINRISKEKKCYKNEPRKSDQQLPTDTNQVLKNGQSLLNTNTYSSDTLNSEKIVCTTDTKNTKEKTCHKRKILPSLLSQPKAKTCLDTQQNRDQQSTRSKSKMVANVMGSPKSDVLAPIIRSMDELIGPTPSGKDKVTSSKSGHKTPTVGQRVEDKPKDDSTSTSDTGPVSAEVKDTHTTRAQYEERSFVNLAKTHGARNINSENYRNGNQNEFDCGLSEDQLSRSNFDSVGLRADRQSDRASNLQGVFPARQQVIDSQKEAILPSRHRRYSESSKTEMNRTQRKEWSKTGSPRSRNERSKHHRRHRRRHRDDGNGGNERAEWRRSSSHHSSIKTSTPRPHHTSDSRKSTCSNSDDDTLPQINPPRYVKEYNHRPSS